MRTKKSDPFEVVRFVLMVFRERPLIVVQELKTQKVVREGDLEVGSVWEQCSEIDGHSDSTCRGMVVALKGNGRDANGNVDL